MENYVDNIAVYATKEDCILFEDQMNHEAEAEAENQTNHINGEKDLIYIYLKEIRGVPLLTKEGEVKIARRIEEGKKISTV